MPWERESAYGARDRTAPIHIITFIAVTPFQGKKKIKPQARKNEWKEKENMTKKGEPNGIERYIKKKVTEYAERKTERYVK